MVTKETVFIYLLGQATAHQKKLIDEWVKQPAQEELFYEWVEEFERLHPQSQFDVEKSWTAFSSRLQQPTIRPVSQPVPAKKKWVAYYAAAAAIAFMALCLSLLYSEPIRYKTYQSGYDRAENITLDDGTQVTLNVNSTLRVPRFAWFEQNREVHLAGEGFFTVTKHKDKKKFIVHTNRQFDIEVLGTQFLVNARENAAARVVLNHGKINLVRHLPNAQIERTEVHPGEEITFQPKTLARVEKKQPPFIPKGWDHLFFHFDHATLQVVVAQFEKKYGLEISVDDPELLKQTISGTFHIKTEENILNLLAELFDGEVTKTKNQIHIQTK